MPPSLEKNLIMISIAIIFKIKLNIKIKIFKHEFENYTMVSPTSALLRTWSSFTPEAVTATTSPPLLSIIRLTNASLSGDPALARMRSSFGHHSSNFS